MIAIKDIQTHTSLGFRDSEILMSNTESSFHNYSGRKLTYVCLSFGTKVSDRACRRC
jgi:hypothetical protein